MKERITWVRREGPGVSGWNGMIGKRRLFQIGMSMSRGEGYSLRTMLPFNMIPEKTTGESDDLKAYAERVLATFVTSLGAGFED